MNRWDVLLFAIPIGLLLLASGISYYSTGEFKEFIIATIIIGIIAISGILLWKWVSFCTDRSVEQEMGE